MIIHVVNNSGRNIKLINRSSSEGQTYLILAWHSMDLPEEFYQIIETQGIPLELDYHKYIAENMEKSHAIH